jgi:hypothetical protein
VLHLGGVGKYVSKIWGWSVHSQESGDLQVLIGTRKKDWKDVNDVPSNMTVLGGYIKISPKRLCTFERKPAFGLNVKKSGGYISLLDKVYFTFAMLCDVEPS